MPLSLLIFQAPSPTASLLAATQASAGAEITLFGWFFYPFLLVAMGLGLYCVFTIHRQAHLSDVQKLKWLLFTLFVPIAGPLAYFLRMRTDKKPPTGV